MYYVPTFIHSFILAISIAPLQVLYHSDALPTTARILYRSFTPKRTNKHYQQNDSPSLQIKVMEVRNYVFVSMFGCVSLSVYLCLTYPNCVVVSLDTLMF